MGEVRESERDALVDPGREVRVVLEDEEVGRARVEAVAPGDAVGGGGGDLAPVRPVELLVEAVADRACGPRRAVDARLARVALEVALEGALDEGVQGVDDDELRPEEGAHVLRDVRAALRVAAEREHDARDLGGKRALRRRFDVAVPRARSRKKHVDPSRR